MEGAELEPFRIYCLCGQKMRVAPEMHGKPGKCVACRQRIRVPHVDELPEGCREIHLKDHPEFLRPRPAPQKAAPRSEGTPSPALAASTPVPAEPSAPDGRSEIEPLDILDSLRLVCSFDYIVHKKLDEFRDGQPTAPVHPDKNALMRYRGLARKARERLDEAMRAHLEQTCAQLMNINEQAARAMLAVRVGDMPYEGYVAAACALRERREWIERRKRNLLGWLTVKDPYRAGGLLSVRFEDVPSGELELPPEEVSEEDTPLLHRAVESLRAAYAAMAKAELHLREREQLRRENRVGGANLEELRSDRVAARERAQAAIEFHRSRLKQLAQDIDNDLKAIEAHLDVARKRFQSGQWEEGAYHAVEMRLLKAQSDNGRAAALAHRALMARSARDMPNPEGTFLQRLVRPDKPGIQTFGVDSYLLWAAGIALAANLMPLAVASQNGADMLFVRGIAVAMFLGAFVSGAIGAIPNRRTRGVLALSFWPVIAIGGAHCIQELRWGMDPLGVALRADPLWYFKPAIAIYAVAAALIGVAGVLASSAFKGWRWLPVPLIAGVLLAALAIVTDGLGAFAARPSVEGPEEILPVAARPGWYQATFTVRNAGARPLWLGGSYPKEPSAARVMAEREYEDGQWQLAGAPTGTKPPKAPQWLKQNESPVVMLEAGEAAAVQFLLPPGDYRVHLVAKVPEDHESFLPFSVGDGSEFDTEPPDSSAPPEESDPQSHEVSSIQAGENAEVRLRGVLAGEDRDIVLQVEVTPPGSNPISQRLSVGDPVYGPWRAAEYNASTNKLTLSDGTRFLVLATGETLRLPGPDEGEPGRT